MYKILTVLIGASFLLVSCGSSTVEKKDESLAMKKSRLDSLKTADGKLQKEISALQTEIDRLDTASGAKEKAKLVTLAALTPTSFTHFIDLQGSVDAVNTSNISPRGNGGVVTQIFVKQGDHVRQGQLLLKLDDAIQRQQLVSDQTQLTYAQDLYQRRKNLWDEKIGTEVDLINAKNAVDQAQARVKIDQQQVDFTSVYADIPGTVNILNVKVGESFGPGSTALQIVNTDNLKVDVLVPEIYQERVRVGTPVKIDFPGLNNKEITGTVSIAGQVINQNNRAFQVEIRLPNRGDIRANQVAIVKLQDYSATNVLTIPINTLQSDESGKYVMVGTQQNGKLIAHKKTITVGQSYADKIQVTGGLQPGDKLITDGFQGLYEGQMISTQ